MKEMEIKIELNREDLEMREKGYKFKLWLETEVEDGMRFRNDYYFKTLEEVNKKINETEEKCRLWDEYCISDMEIIDLEKEVLI